MSSREDRIMNLATTLKASGLAKSEAQARMMAEEMIGVEENVQKTYEEEHTKAHEYLKTAKNLGTPRFKEQPKTVEQKPKIGPIGTRIQPLATAPVQEKPVTPSERNTSENNTLLKSVDETAHEKKVELEPVHTDVNFGKGTLKDMMLNQIKAENHEIKTIEQLGEEAENRKAQEKIEEKVEETVEETVEESKDESKDESKNIPEGFVLEESAPEETAGDIAESNDDSTEESNEETSSEDAPKLDGDKLREMMEEDGPMEEHTREITEKPKDVKPKEDYVENTVDLSDMFNVNKR